MKRKQSGVTYTMFIIAVVLGSSGSVAVTSEYVGSFSSLSVCETERARVEAEDVARMAQYPNGQKIHMMRQCMRRS